MTHAINITIEKLGDREKEKPKSPQKSTFKAAHDNGYKKKKPPPIMTDFNKSKK